MEFLKENGWLKRSIIKATMALFKSLNNHSNDLQLVLSQCINVAEQFNMCKFLDRKIPTCVVLRFSVYIKLLKAIPGNDSKLQQSDCTHDAFIN